MSMLKVFLPKSLIACPINMDVNSEAVSLVIDPVPFIDIAIDMNELSLAMSPVVLPVALVAGPIDPGLFAVTVPEPTDPLALVSGTGAKCVELSLLALGIGVVQSFGEGFTLLIKKEVARVRSL